jgi:hypothetical protein
VPCLADCLPSDEADPVPTKYVSNRSRGNGSGSSPASAQEVQVTHNGASLGDTFLAVCQTPRTTEFWDCPSGLSLPNGSSGNHITYRPRQVDVIVISVAAQFAAFRTPTSATWTKAGPASTTSTSISGEALCA